MKKGLTYISISFMVLALNSCKPKATFREVLERDFQEIMSSWSDNTSALVKKATPVQQDNFKYWSEEMGMEYARIVVLEKLLVDSTLHPQKLVIVKEILNIGRGNTIIVSFDKLDKVGVFNFLDSTNYKMDYEYPFYSPSKWKHTLDTLENSKDKAVIIDDADGSFGKGYLLTTRFELIRDKIVITGQVLDF